MSARGGIYIDRAMVASRAFLELTGRAPQALMIFLGKRQVEKLKRAGPRGERFRVTNGRSLEFTFLEALHRYGMSSRVFTHALDELIEHGFIDIEKHGGGLNTDKTVYALSDRWRRYGTPDFEHKTRPRGRPWILPEKTEPTGAEARCPTCAEARCEPSSTCADVRCKASRQPALNVRKGPCSTVHQSVPSAQTKPDPARRAAGARRAAIPETRSEASAAEGRPPVVAVGEVENGSAGKNGREIDEEKPDRAATVRLNDH